LNNCVKIIKIIITKDFKEIGGDSWYYWKVLDEQDFLEVIFVIFRPMMKEIFESFWTLQI
jgi:hypothetical protein